MKQIEPMESKKSASRRGIDLNEVKKITNTFFF